MSSRRSVLAPLLALALLLVGATSAHAGAMTLTGTVVGAGKIQAVSGGTYTCDFSSHELETDSDTCDNAFFNATFAVSLTLRAVPDSGWKRSDWSGCDKVNDNGDCEVSGPSFSRGYKSVTATFEDTAGPATHFDLQRHNGDSTIDLAFHADEPATFRCGVLTTTLQPCASPYHTSILPQNMYSWYVEATDRNGSTTLIRSEVWSDVQSQIFGGPAGLTNATGGAITFGNVMGGQTDGFQCRLDGGDWAGCSSPWNLSGLAEGHHKAEVRGYRSGSYEIDPSVHEWTVDTTPPDTTITGGPTGQVANASPTFVMDSSEPFNWECQLDGGAWQTCGKIKTFNSLADGAHTFAARALDAAGNVDPTPATRSWTQDTTPSVTAIQTGPADGSAVASDQASFTFAAGDGATFECQLDGAAWAPCASPFATGQLAEGQHTWRVRSTDDAGNVEAPKSRTWTIDTTPPTTTITAGPAAGSTLPAGSSPQFTFGAPGATKLECRVDAGAWAACTSPTTLAGLAAGAHTFAVRATDALGNVEKTGASRTFTIAAPSSATGDGGAKGETTGGGAKGEATGGGAASGGTSGAAAGGTPPGTGGQVGGQSGAPSTGGPAAARPSFAGRVKGVAKVDRRGRFTIGGLKVACPAAGACTVTATATGRFKAMGRATVAAGRSAAIRVTLTRRALAALKAGRTAKVKITLRAGGPGGTATRTVTVAVRRG